MRLALYSGNGRTQSPEGLNTEGEGEEEAEETVVNFVGSTFLDEYVSVIGVCINFVISSYRYNLPQVPTTRLEMAVNRRVVGSSPT